MTENQSILILCGVCCIYPLLSAVIGIALYKRYEAGGWRGVILGNKAGIK